MGAIANTFKLDNTNDRVSLCLFMYNNYSLNFIKTHIPELEATSQPLENTTSKLRNCMIKYACMGMTQCVSHLIQSISML